MRHRFVVVKVPCEDGDFTFHLVLDENDMAVKMHIGGWWGKPRSTDIEPFVLMSNGQMDMGATPEYDAEDLIERLGETDLFKRPVFVGREVTIDFTDRPAYALKVDTIEEIVGTGPGAHLPA